uniref:AT1G65230-like protein n=1 Tax=Cannabis sativa TaxID=3483 RepID=A0A803PTE8_CANSA
MSSHQCLSPAVWGEMSASVSSSALAAITAKAGAAAAAAASTTTGIRHKKFSVTYKPSIAPSHCRHSFSLRVTNNDSSRTEVSTTTDQAIEKSDDVNKMIDGMNFGELCNEFECISSPLVESTARQLARDILELREGNRALGTYAISVKYKDPLRSFTGREKYKRPLWITTALDSPSVSVQEMVMLTTSVLSIKWTIKGKPKSFIAGVGGELVIRINSKFTLNQISGQVTEHEESWDLSSSSSFTQAYFWTSRRIFATTETAKDLADLVKNLSRGFPKENQNMEIYPDPSGDPTKFFQRDDSFQRDAYQIALLLAVLYLVVQFLRTTL